MRTQTSIEVHPTGSRVVHVEVSGGGRTFTADQVRVRSFAVDLPAIDDPRFREALQQLRQDRRLPRRAVVTIWGLRTAHHFLRLPPGQTADLQALALREARKDITQFERDGGRAIVASTVGSEAQVGAHRRREVSVVIASAADIQRALQPIVDAGFSIETVLSPALALAAVARRDGAAASAAGGMYVALGERATCIAVVRQGLLLMVRELEGGFTAGEAADDVAERLAGELRRSILLVKQTLRSSVPAVVLCGDMPNLRSLTRPLSSLINLPVQTLDSLAGIDAGAVPQPADQFRTQVAALRLAIAAGAEAAPAANLVPTALKLSRQAHERLVRFGVAAAASLVLVGGWYWSTSRSLEARRVTIATLEREVAVLEPEAQRRDSLRHAWTTAQAQQAALGAFETQGPRLARFLEVLAVSMPDEIVLRSIDLTSAGTTWRTVLTGTAVSSDAASGQAAMNGLLRALAASPYAGASAEGPSLRVVSDAGIAADGGEDDEAAPADTRIPAGRSGVEFELKLELPK